MGAGCGWRTNTCKVGAVLRFWALMVRRFHSWSFVFPFQSASEKHKINVPETMNEYLDMSDDEGRSGLRPLTSDPAEVISTTHENHICSPELTSQTFSNTSSVSTQV